MGETAFVSTRIEALNPTTELARCGHILQNIVDEMQLPEFDHKQRLDCRSRLIHLVDRIKRVRPISPEEQTVVYEMLSLTEAKLAVYANPFRGRTPVPATKPNSPCCPAINKSAI